jgi:hypothetical protein
VLFRRCPVRAVTMASTATRVDSSRSVPDVLVRIAPLARESRDSREPASQVPSPRRTVDDVAARLGVAGRSSVVRPRASFMAAS